MNMSSLALLSTEALQKLQLAVDAVLETRLDTTLRYGRLATFKDKDGRDRTITIDRISGKSVSGQETGSSVNPGGKWRVGKGNLTIVPEVRKVALPSKLPLAPHKPHSAESGSW